MPKYIVLMKDGSTHRVDAQKWIRDEGMAVFKSDREEKLAVQLDALDRVEIEGEVETEESPGPMIG